MERVGVVVLVWSSELDLEEAKMESGGRDGVGERRGSGRREG